MTQSAILAASGSAGTTQGFKNRIINGNMVIDQRNAGASVTPTANAYTLDRWRSSFSQASKFTVQQNAGSVTTPVGFTNYLGVTSSSAYSISASDYFFQLQRIEGYNVADLGWGTANAKTVTLSFWVRSSLTGAFGGSIQNDAGDRSYPFTYTISSANTWTQISITIAGCTDGTWLTTNGNGLGLFFSIGTGNFYSATAGAWANGNYFSSTSSVSVVGTSGATWYVTGVQLEVGTTATNFDFRSIGTELQLCQRYYNKLLSGTGSNTAWGNGMFTSSTGIRICVTYPVMRTSPTVAIYSTAANDTQARISITAMVSGYVGPTSFMNDFSIASGGTTYRPCFITTDGDTTGYISLTAEL